MQFLYDISVSDFQALHIAEGWKYLDNALVKKSLDNSMFKITAIEDGKAVGIARIIGDYATHGLLSDVIVHPDYQGKGIGKAMITTLLDSLQQFVDDGRDEFLLEALPTNGKEGFYVKCGFKYKPENMAGVYLWLKNKNLYNKDSKKYYIHLHKEPFLHIKSGSKTIEMRLMDEKRQKLKIGDYIIFINRNDEEERLKTKIVGLHKFRSFGELYERFDKVSLGYSENEDAKPSDMEKYYPKEEIKRYGVVGIEIQIINQG